MPHAEVLDDRRIGVTTTYRDKELIKLVPGSRWESEGRFWTTPLSWAACLQLRGVFGDELMIGPKLVDWSWTNFRNRVEPATRLRDLLAYDHDEPTRADGRSLFPFQSVGSDWLDTAGDGLLGDELGLGKTITALTALGQELLPALVICPNSVKRAWALRTSEWLEEATPYVVSGGAAARRKIIDRARKDPTALVTVNIEAVRLLSRLAPFGSVALKRCRECDPVRGEEGMTAARCEVHPKELNGFGFRVVILDEAHRIKEPQSKQTRACWAVGHDPSVRLRWALTGTPVANHIGDLWSIMHFVAPYEWPTKSKWVDRYALTAWGRHGGLDIVGINPTTRDEFHRILDPRFRRVPKALVLDQLPSKVRSTRWVEMSSRQRMAYEELERQSVTRLDDGELLVTPNNLVRRTRLLQLSSSYATVEQVEQPLTVLSECSCYAAGLDSHDDDCLLKWKMVVRLAEPSPKLDALDEIVDERGGDPLVVAAMSRQLIMLAAARLERRGTSHGLIVGGVSDYERDRVLARFNRDELQVVLLTLQAGGTGVDGLQRSDTLVALQRSWSMLDNVQVEGRVDRIGSERHESIHIIDVVAQDTVEETVLFPRLQRKFAQLEEVNRDRARLLAAGVESPDLFVLDDRESHIIGADLGVPDREAVTT